MAADNEDDQGLFEAHSPEEKSPDPRVAKVGATRAMTEAALTELAAQMADRSEANQPSLLLDELDEQQALFGGPVRHVASTINRSRGRGRPKGSPNKASGEFRDTLMRMGYRHPGLNLAAIANADPVRLAAELSAPYRNKAGDVVEASMTPGDALGLILKANAELLPYFESKRPTEIKVDKRTLGVMFVGEMPTAREDDGGFMDITKAPRPE